MEVTFSSNPGAQTLGTVLVLGEHHKMLHADLSLSFSPPASWHMGKKQDTRQSRIIRSHLDILRSKLSVLSVLKEGKFISDQEMMLETQHQSYNPGNKTRKQRIQKARWQTADPKAEEILPACFAQTKQGIFFNFQLVPNNLCFFVIRRLHTKLLISSSS